MFPKSLIGDSVKSIGGSVPGSPMDKIAHNLLSTLDTT
jgi:hypothetical protein